MNAFDKTLKASDVQHFSGWTDSDFESARLWIRMCFRPTFFFQRHKADEAINSRLHALDKIQQLAVKYDDEQRAAQAQRMLERQAQVNEERETEARLFRQRHAGRCVASGRKVRIFASTNKRLGTCDRVPSNMLNTILFVDEPCPLPIVGAENMHRAWMHYGSNQLGCWYQTLDDGYVFVGSLPELTHSVSLPVNSLPRTVLQSDGTAIIVEPEYDSETFSTDVISRKLLKDLREHRSEKP